MLVKFKSKASAEVIMYEEHAKMILDLLGKEAKQGIITAEETGNAIAAIEGEIERINRLAAAEEAQKKEQKDDDYDEDEAVKQPETVKFSTRAYPLLEMLRAAQRANQHVVWGV
jgi:hypothetical protein